MEAFVSFDWLGPALGVLLVVLREANLYIRRHRSLQKKLVDFLGSENLEKTKVQGRIRRRHFNNLLYEKADELYESVSIFLFSKGHTLVELNDFEFDIDDPEDRLKHVLNILMNILEVTHGSRDWYTRTVITEYIGDIHLWLLAYEKGPAFLRKVRSTTRHAA